MLHPPWGRIGAKKRILVLIAYCFLRLPSCKDCRSVFGKNDVDLLGHPIFLLRFYT